MVKIKAAWRQNLVAEQNLQAFSGPLVDQNGHWVRYEVVLNDVEYNYIVENKLYNQEGQAEFLRDQPIDFPRTMAPPVTARLRSNSPGRKSGQTTSGRIFSFGPAR